MARFTVKRTLHRYGVGTYAYINTYAILDNGVVLPDYGNLTSESRATAYARARNNGMSSNDALNYVLDNVRP